jgi:hypothetical protein
MCCCLLFLAADGFGQTLQWETVDDLSGGTDLARAITLSQKSVIVIGNSAGPEDVNDFVIHALRRRDGAAQWTDRVPSDTGISTGLQITSARGRVFAAGYAVDESGQGSDIVIRAYNAATGTLLWNNVWDVGRDDFPHAIAAGPAAVVAVGIGGGSTTRRLSFVVRVYDPSSGAVLWEDRVEKPGTDASASTVAVTNNRVFVAGNTVDGGQSDGLLRVYNAASGALEWELTQRSLFPSALKVVGRRLFMAGSFFDHSYLGAFDTRSGAVLWEDSGTEARGYVRDIAIEGDRIVAVGGGSSGLRVHSYDVVSGLLDWADRTSVLPGFQEFGTSVATNGRAVYVAGASAQDFGYAEIMVRAYDAKTGMLLWDDRSHRSGRPTTAVDVALGKKRLFVAGYAAGQGLDFVVRAYDIRQDGERDVQED